jgi:trimeric autotransporter adhesin
MLVTISANRSPSPTISSSWAPPNESSAATGSNGDQSDNNGHEAGAAYVFSRTGYSWTQQTYLKASNTDAEDHFDYAVAVFEDTIAVGAPDEDSAGTGINGALADNSN